jgi:hypothetical protein
MEIPIIQFPPVSYYFHPLKTKTILSTLFQNNLNLLM